MWRGSPEHVIPGVCLERRESVLVVGWGGRRKSEVRAGFEISNHQLPTINHRIQTQIPGDQSRRREFKNTINP
jgi:hypothetical protein